MEKEYEGKVKYLHELSKSSKRMEEPELEEEHIKEVLREVLNELYYSKRRK